jgi:type I restriction enzyme M protein
LTAAVTLGLIKESHSGLKLTELGRQLANSAVNSEDERETLKAAVSNSSVIRAIAPDLLSSQGPNLAEIETRIQRTFRLGGATAKHRAAMLGKWRKQLLDPQMRIIGKEATGGTWRRLQVRNFRSIEFADIELAPFTVVVGPNGSGKSNFADAFVFARDVSTDAAAAISSRGGIVGVRRWRPSKPTDVAIDLWVAASQKGLAKEYARHFVKIHSGAAGAWSFSKEVVEIVSPRQQRTFAERSGSVVQTSVGRIGHVNPDASIFAVARQLREFAGTSALRAVRRYRLNPEAMRQPQLSSEETRLHETGENIAVAIRSMRQAGGIQKLLQPMGKIVPGLQDIYVEQAGRFLVLKFKQLQEGGAVADFNATEMSEGALRSLGIIVGTLQMQREELLIIEEPEVSIHTGAAALLFEILKDASERGAVLVTTHSADLLDAAKDEEILVCEYVEGNTRIGPLSEAQRKIVRQGLFTVAELMRSEPLRIEGSTSPTVST